MKLYLSCFVIFLLGACKPVPDQRKPNILLVLADDLGYGDLGVYNAHSKVPTPHLDRLAAEGIRFTDAYCPSSVCTPTRYSLMTGEYAWRSARQKGVMANYEPSLIRKDQVTLPQMLQQAGYKTAGFGKWHLGTTFPTTDGQQPVGYGKFHDDRNGANVNVWGDISDGPLDYGFDHWLGFSCASECWVFQNNKIMGAIKHDLYNIDAALDTDHLIQIPLANYLPFITEKSIRYIREQATTHEPFFLYFSPYVPHIPLAVSPEFLGKTQAGTYGDYVYELDHYIGELLNALEAAGILDNTLILFASDNGSQFMATSPADDPKKATNSPKDVALPADAHAHYPNFPLRGTKWTIYEGGVRTPLIARWPGQFPKGKVSHELIALNDLLPTLAALLGQELPKGIPKDGFDMSSAFFGGLGTRDAVLVHASSGVIGLRWDKWKYVGGNNDTLAVNAPAGELYDLSVDIGERNNLYVQEPEVVKKMQSMLEYMLK
jgi:arylsulfatase A-like enzyme